MVIRRRPEGQPVFTEHQHAVNRKITHAGVRIFADLHADGDVGTAVFARVGDDRQFAQIDLIPGPFDLFAWRTRNDLGRDAFVFQSQIALEHLLLRHAKTEGDQLARREQPAQNAPTGIAFDVLEQQCRTFDVRSFAHARGNFVLDVDFVLDPQELFLAFQVSQKSPEIFKHRECPFTLATSLLTQVSVASPLPFRTSSPLTGEE